MLSANILVGGAAGKPEIEFNTRSVCFTDSVGGVEAPNSPTLFPTSFPTNASYTERSTPASSESYDDTPVSATTPPRRVKVDFKQRSRPPAPSLNKAVSLSE